MPPIAHPRHSADPERRLMVAHVEDAPAPDVVSPGGEPAPNLRHDSEDAVVQAVARRAQPPELIRIVMHELAKDAARIEWLVAHPTAFPTDVMVEFGRMAGRRQRVLRGLVTSALRDLDAEREEADVPPEVLARLEQMFVQTVLGAAKQVCSAEESARFEARLMEKMSG